MERDVIQSGHSCDLYWEGSVFFENEGEIAEIDVESLDPKVPERKLIDTYWEDNTMKISWTDGEDGYQSSKTSQEESRMGSETYGFSQLIDFHSFIICIIRYHIILSKIML